MTQGEIEAETVDAFVSGRVRVLLVDDNTINRKIAGGFLKPYGFELTETDSGSGAIELVKSTKFDIIFMDHMMPVMDGMETVQHIRKECGENGKSPIIIALTADEMERAREEFLNNGFQDFLAKPLSGEALDELLLKWIPEGKRGLLREGEDGQAQEEIRAVRIPGIEIEPLTRYHTGSLQEYQELLDIYCLDGERKAGLLQDLVKRQEYENYGIEVHGLKSASANIGAMQVSALAKEQEEAALRKDAVFIEEHFPALLAAYEQQMKELRSYLEKHPAEPAGGALLPEPDRETIRAALQKALQALENFYSRECRNQIGELLRHQLSPDITAKLQEIMSRLKMYEDDAAELLFHQLLKQLDKEENAK